MTFDVSRAVAGIERLRHLDPGFAIFGSAEHRYQLNEPLSETVVAKFEKQHSIVLPDDYRRYLTEMGNGGAGPAYGVFRLGEMGECESYRRWKPGGRLHRNAVRAVPAHAPMEQAASPAESR
jgi:hypothetical protein